MSQGSARETRQKISDFPKGSKKEFTAMRWWTCVEELGGHDEIFFGRGGRGG